jgi:ribosomal-protein-alanine N-acetyltransferase
MSISFFLIDAPAARAIVRWCYEPPYDIYNLEDSPETIQYALDPQNNFYAMRDKSGELIGFCSFGKDGQVPGGGYTDDALDIGMGIRPDLTGRGRGSDFAAAVLDFARREFHPLAFRVTIAAFNQRAQRLWEKNGFHPIRRFTHKASERKFVIMFAESANQRFSKSTT